ncbi:uncharacterized protein LOC121419695 [Lytechinus variegatus]|uniref:uncharacterized protein LOC121419695 n=1 Tax=Lytechinus variegatus TaxID=7654 RepID=UPI001BB26E32|nr:uncharacterized protein LOC121419695 [Lytechinus variegatus]
MVKLIILITLLITHIVYESEGIFLMQGQEANLIFPYPCDSTKITLQQSNRWPLYRSTKGSSLSLPANQVQRFEVNNMIIKGNCSLDLTIRDLMKDDQGTYILLVYKDGDIIGDGTHRVWLEVDYPPGNASCVVGNDRGGDWVAVDCTAKAGSLPGNIECYQDGLWMPPLTKPIETGSLLKQTLLIRKSQPVFCCSSDRQEDKSRCACDDCALFLQNIHSTDPCPTEPIVTKIPTISTIMSTKNKYKPTDVAAIMMSTVFVLSTSTNEMKNTGKEPKAVIYSLTIPVAMVSFILIMYYVWNKASRANVGQKTNLHRKTYKRAYTEKRAKGVTEKQITNHCYQPLKHVKRSAEISDEFGINRNESRAMTM